MNLPVTLTITPIYAALLALLFLGLSLKVIGMRRKHHIGIGDGGNRELARAIRVQANFVEYVPMALLLLFALEMQGSSAWLLHTLGAGLLAARLGHAWGLQQSIGTTPGRLLGVLATFLVLAVAAVMLLAGAFG